VVIKSLFGNLPLSITTDYYSHFFNNLPGNQKRIDIEIDNLCDLRKKFPKITYPKVILIFFKKKAKPTDTDRDFALVLDFEVKFWLELGINIRVIISKVTPNWRYGTQVWGPNEESGCKQQHTG
jgi:hypothetical protein